MSDDTKRVGDEALEWLTGGGAPTAKFPEVGAKIVGTVTEYELKQARDFKTKKLRTWDDGNPVMEAVVTVKAEEFVPEDDEDDGSRRIFVSSRSMREAIRGAIKKSGHRGSLVGGKLGVVYAKDGEAEAGLNPPKVYTAKFEPPVAEIPGDEYEPGEEPF